MDNDAPPEPEPDARARLTHDQAQELVLRIVSTQAESLLRTAYRNSLCDDDAHDAYQRSMEIFLRRARTLDPRSAHKWIHVVVKREAQQLRRARSGSVPYEAIDFDLHEAMEVSTPEERVLAKDRARRAAEALRRLKPQERRAMGLKAFGHSYDEIAQATGYSGTKVCCRVCPTHPPG
jgi:RNA polymerase sigma factor (sigma-70 family)